MEFCQFAGNRRPAIAEYFERGFQGGRYAVRSFVKNQRRRNRAQLFQSRATRIRAGGQKASKEKLIRRQSRSYQGRNQGSRARNRNHWNITFGRRLNNAKSRIANQRRAGV